MKNCETYRYEIEALKVVNQEITKNWEIEGVNDLETALKTAKSYAEGHELWLKKDGYNQVVVNKLYYDENGEHDGADEIECFDVK